MGPLGQNRLDEWNGLTWGTWENGGEDCLMWHISNNPQCLGKESWENSELSILPIQVFQICQGNTFQNWMLKRIVPKGEMKMPKFSVQYCQACPWQYGGKKRLGQQSATLSRCKTESVSVPLWKGRLGGSYHTHQFSGLLESIFPNPKTSISHGSISILRKKTLVFDILILKTNFIQNVRD